MMTYMHFCVYFERKELDINFAKNVSKSSKVKWNTYFEPIKHFSLVLWFSG
jgi:hypothetical protein